MAPSCKLPAYLPSDPEAWFAQVGACFDAYKVTNDAEQYALTVSALPPDTIQEVRAVVVTPPTTDRFAALKTALLAAAKVCRSRQRDLLLTNSSYCSLGDRTPSQMLQQMQLLLRPASGACDNDLLRVLFLQRLPLHIRMLLLAQSDDVTPESLARIADRVHSAPGDSLWSRNILASDHSPVTTQINSQHLSAIQSRQHSQGKSGSPSMTSDSDPAYCYYHRRFGARARNCRQPCTYSGNGSGGVC